MDITVVDAKHLVSVGNKLIDKLSSAVCWCFTRETPERIALKIYINDIQNSNLQPLTKAALTWKDKSTIKEYINQHDIVEESFKYLGANAEPDKVNDDWLAQFMDKAKLVSDIEFKKIWGRILAEECNNPGMVSKQVLNIVSMMDRQDAMAFTGICRFSLKLDCDDEDTRVFKYPLILDSKIDDYYSKYDITLDNLRTLESYGLIERIQNNTFGVNYSLRTDNDIISINYSGNRFEFEPNTREIRQGNVIFKKPGRELCRVLDVEPISDFWNEIALPYFEGILTV